MHTMPAPTVRLLLLKSGAGSGAKIAHQGGYAKYGNPPRWHVITAAKPAPKGAPVAAHPKAAGHHEPAAHFTDDQWAALKLPDSNVNAPVFNKALEKLKAWSDAGDVTAIVGASFGSNTYGQKLAKIANTLLGMHGSAHKVTPGQKPGTHAASQVAEPADPHPTGLPEHLAPRAAKPEAEPAAAVVAPAPTTPGPLTMPDFEEGKTIAGVKDWYQHFAQQVIDHGHSGNVEVLENMKKYGLKPNAKGKVSKTWAGTTVNSKKLLALHAAALAHAGGGAPAVAPEPVAPAAQTDPSPRLVLPKKASAVPAAAAPEPTPKEGDTKPGAEGGTLVLKDGHWVKQGGDAATVAPATQAAPTPTTSPLTAEQLANLQSIPWYKLKLPDSNSNAKSHNKQVEKIEAMAFAGDVAGLKAFADKKAGAKQAYAKKQHLLAMSALDFLNGSGPTAEQKVRAAKVAAPPEPDKYPVVTEWKTAIVAGKVPTKAQAEAYEALGKHDPAAQSEYFLDAVADSIPKSVPVDGDEFDAAYKAANEKVGELHGHALAGTKPGDKPAAVTADTPLTDGQLLALESFSLDELKALDGGPNLPPNVQAWVGKKLADQAAADSVPAYPKKMIDDYAASGDWSGVQMIIDNSPTPSVVAYAKQVLAGKPAPKPTRLVAKPAPSQAIPSNGPEAANALEKLENDIGSAGSATEATKIAWDYVNLSGLTSAAYSDAADALMAHGYSAAAQGFATNSKNVKDYNTGPKEGDTKQGADGMLVLKNGHWVKADEPAPAEPAIKKLTPGQAIKIMASVSAKTAAGNKAKMKAMAVAGDVAGLQAFAENKNFPASKVVAKKLIEAMTGGVAVPPASGTPAPAPAAPTTPPTVNGLPSMDNWVQIGQQGGSNPGGKFKDPSGQEWYCKWPDDAEAAKSEVLAAKLYALAGLSAQDCMLVSKGGKTAIATKWVNIQKAPSPAALAAADGALAGFAVDAWLGNWDVVGLAFDNLQIGPDGKAHRVDAGGSLEYRAQGEKKPFGPKVDELDTLRDAGKNAQAAAVFKGMTKADMTASAAKVLAISDVAIRAMVNQYGPGDEAAKKKMAETLIARKQDLLKRYPEAAKKKKAPTFKPEDISAPPSFLNWGGSGMGGPSSKEFLNKANEDAVQAIFAAAKTGDVEAVKKLTAPVFDKGTGAVTGQQSVLYHPSQHVSGYAQQAINEINYQLNPPKQFRFDGGHPLHSLNAAYPSHKGAPSSAAAQKLGKFIALGEPGVIALADLALPAKITHAEGGGTLSVHTYAKQAQAAIAKMPATQKQAIKSYTGNSYHAMNGSLWGGNPTGAAKAAGEALKTLGHDIEPGTILSRHLSLHGKDLNDILGSVGKVLQEPAIMSTSIRPSSWIRNVQFKLHVGPGVKGLWVGYNSLPGGEALSKNAGEDEMVLPPGTRLLVLSVRKGGKDADGFGAHGQQHVIEAIILPTE